MPRPNPPPTPGSSSDIWGKDGNHAAPDFNLPPTAYQEHDRASTSSTASSGTGSDSSYRPVSPTSRETSRKRQHTGAVITKDDFALPPPPTRSRKIIQMQPNTEQEAPTSSNAKATAGKTQTTTQAGSKRKQTSNGTTAAGRKIARKTAHSLIERRRRSKMNEEFGVLKDMIPACKGQEMHKLAILQASIEYTRYLEQCVSDLQAQNSSSNSQPPPVAFRRTEHNEEEDDDDEMEDDEPTDARTSTPVNTGLQQSSSAISLPSLSQITTASTSSPSILSTGAGRQYSISSAASQSSYSPYFPSNQASPAFGPQLHHVSGQPLFTSGFGLGSPALKPVDSASALRQIAEGATELSDQQRFARKTGRTERDQDHEATAALLMLNHDRRNSVRQTTGMSVRDLLSS
ncbi:uncharacterized protein RCC_02780 [Ramularia collo-cygni]|uniref:BHLH domain-containing protein n=1 Tax=Ramularia collo-cygni TaxID=112498 RepID=A0A2D3V096_9PEZI|nr:uncharacterized protein RCC_02780 [Ramularia collo-cygni]CZT16946.1 uncharacterized protein RCC_02780 [Ramularia collo-cygni]